MCKITFITGDGKETTIHSAQGTVMEAAVEHGIEGIGGDCGGVGSCGTCHIYVTPEWMNRVGPASDLERGAINDPKKISPWSRLACQVELTEKLDGLVVQVPDHGQK